MPRSISLLSISATMLAFCLWSGAAQAQASRTWVSGVGDDANPCSRTAPCKTFAGAISKTAAGGEIDALDPGGFGAVTITKAITIDGGGGQVASVLVSGTNGIVVAANPLTDVVILRNLRINGIGTGLNGIRFLAGKALIVENCNIFGFTQNGIDVALTAAGKVAVSDSEIKNNTGVGIRVATTVGAVLADIAHVRSDSNGIGFQFVGSGGSVGAIIDRSNASLNGTGVSATSATVLLGNTTIAGNGTGVTGSAILSYKNNEINGNGTDGTPLPQVQLN